MRHAPRYMDAISQRSRDRYRRAKLLWMGVPSGVAVAYLIWLAMVGK